MKTKLSLLAGAALLCASSYASALTISGLTLPSGADQLIVGTVYENIVTAVGQNLSGYGKVGQINSDSLNLVGELTFTFGGYTVDSFTSATDLTFSGGFVNFYIDSTADFSKDSAASAGDGILFLTLSGEGLISNNVVTGSGKLQGAGNGVLNVDYTGLANGNTAGAGATGNAFFDTNGFSGKDFVFNTSYTIYSSNPGLDGCPNGTPCVRGSANLEAVVAIPEPETYALMAAGLGVVGWVARRRKQTV